MNTVVQIDGKGLYSYLYPKEIYNYSKIRLIISDFVKLIEEFLKLTNYMQNNIYQNLDLLEDLRQRGADKCFLMLADKLHKEINNRTIFRIEEYFFLARLTPYSVMYQINKMKQLDIKRFEKSSHYYQLLFLLSNIQNYNLNRISFAPWNKDLKVEGFLIVECINHISKNEQYFRNSHILVYIEYLICKMFDDCENYSLHSKLFNIVKDKYSDLTMTYLTHIFYSFNAQYITATNNSFDIGIHKKKFYNVVNFFFDKGFFNSYKFIPPEMFFNVINISSDLNLRFAKNFLDLYQSKLDKEVKNDIQCLSKTKILMIEGKYTNAINVLNKIDMVNYQVYLVSRTYLAMIYYKISELETLLYLIDASKHFLYRHKAELGSRYDRFLNFYLYLLRLIRVGSIDKKKLTQYKCEIKNISNIVGKDWLITEINELMKK
ncbi:MAG: hypothetical protein ABI543_00125 [Ignavibacteria bacterium]